MVCHDFKEYFFRYQKYQNMAFTITGGFYPEDDWRAGRFYFFVAVAIMMMTRADCPV